MPGLKGRDVLPLAHVGRLDQWLAAVVTNGPSSSVSPIFPGLAIVKNKQTTTTKTFKIIQQV